MTIISHPPPYHWAMTAPCLHPSHHHHTPRSLIIMSMINSDYYKLWNLTLPSDTRSTIFAYPQRLGFKILPCRLVVSGHIIIVISPASQVAGQISTSKLSRVYHLCTKSPQDDLYPYDEPSNLARPVWIRIGIATLAFVWTFITWSWQSLRKPQIRTTKTKSQFNWAL